MDMIYDLFFNPVEFDCKEIGTKVEPSFFVEYSCKTDTLILHFLYLCCTNYVRHLINVTWYSFPVWLRNGLLTAGLEPDWKIMYSIELQTIFYKYQIKIIKLIPVLIDNFSFWYPRGKLSIIRCDKYILEHCF